MWNVGCIRTARINEDMSITISFADDDPHDARKKSVLIVDDEPGVVNLLHDLLSGTYPCLTASSGPEALKHFETNEIAVVLSDIRMSDMTGLELLPLINNVSPNTVCIMVSGEKAMDTAIGALQVGAFDFIRKPFNLSDAVTAVERAMEKHLAIVQRESQDKEMRELLTNQKDQLEFLKYHDALTGLANHEFLTRETTRAITAAMTDKRGVAFVRLALDRFKSIKESLGPEIAGIILREVAGRWIEKLPAQATLARFEEDEFGLVLPCPDCSVEALEVLRELNQTLREPVYVGSLEFDLAITAGISVFPNDGTDAKSLERSAGVALAQSRVKGAETFKFHKPEMNTSAERRLTLESGLRQALKAGDIVNYYQPKIDFATGRIVGMEALVRWNNPEHGSVSATEIVAIAEEVGLIELLGLQVLENACRDTSCLVEEGFDLKVSVNLSGQQLADSWFPQAVERAIVSAKLRPDRLELEITETSLIQNAETAISVLDAIRSFGVSVAIDDFGTGFSSLGYLKKFPLDTLKIDRLFVSDLATDLDDAEFVYAIVSLAQKLKLRTVVEGVETAEQLDLLRPSGCDEWQGFLCSKPVPFDEFRSLIKTTGKAS
jgi:diguanylate cyclase (GGDEF)-like protein